MAKDSSSEIPSSSSAASRSAASASKPQPSDSSEQEKAQEQQPAPQQPAATRSLLREAEEKLALIRDHREIFEWILDKQAALRTEFVGFLKKDLREIDYVVTDINVQGDKAEFASSALELIKNTYIKHWERSFELISPENVLQQSSPQKE